MSERIARESVTFVEPFFVEGLGREQPAGTYEVETVEELIEGLSFPAYRMVSMSIVLPLRGRGPHSYQLARIDASLVRAARSGAEKR
ncbi:MAG TPA: hypothetical protein VGA77_14505 [Propylenella sp.]